MPKNKYQIYLDDDTTAYLERLCKRYEWTMSTLVDRLARFHHSLLCEFDGNVTGSWPPVNSEPQITISRKTRNTSMVRQTCSTGIAMLTLKIVREGLTPMDGFPDYGQYGGEDWVIETGEWNSPAQDGRKPQDVEKPQKGGKEGEEKIAGSSVKRRGQR